MNCPEATGKVINLGSSEEVSIHELADRIKRLTGSKSEIEFIPYESVYGENFEDICRRVPDLSLARQIIGFRPKYSLADIIHCAVEYERSTGCAPEKRV